ncbi:MAG: hypothetical protein HYZ26_12250 [Chloroflexi bacterium]|nr:hypothetical protein [Chloroflexota bacterium]
MALPLMKWLKLKWPLLAVLAVAAWLRAIWGAGIGLGETVFSAEAAWHATGGMRAVLAGGNAGAIAVELLARHPPQVLLAQFPLAVLYFLFGVSDTSTFFLPVATSLLNVALVYGLGLAVSGPKTALLSAMLWAALPVDVFFGAALKPNALVVLAGLWVLRSTLTSPGRISGWHWLSLGVSIVFVGVYSLPLGVALAGIVGISLLRPRTLGSRPGVAPWLVAAILAGFLALAPLAELHDRLLEALRRPEMLLWILALAVWRLERTEVRATVRPDFSLAFGLLLAGYLGELLATPGDQAFEALGYGLTFALPVVFVSAFLTQLLGGKSTRTATSAAAVLALGGFLLARPNGIHIAQFDNPEWLLAGHAALLFNGMRGLTFLALACLAFRPARPAIRQRLAFLAAVGLGVSSLPIMAEAKERYALPVEPWRAAVAAVRSKDLGGPILVGSVLHEALLRYATGFDDDSVDINRMTRAPGAYTSGFTLLEEDDFWEEAWPANWRFQAAFGELETPRLVLMAIESEAVRCEDEIRRAAQPGAGLTPVLDLEGCRAGIAGENLVDGVLKQEARFLRTFLVVEELGGGGLRVGHKYMVFPDGRTFDTTVTLQPNSVYYLEITMMSEGPATALYWRTGDEEFAYGLVWPQQPQAFGAILTTPDWPGPQAVAISPLLISDTFWAEILDFGLYSIEP